jgi:hypothetical protein
MEFLLLYSQIDVSYKPTTADGTLQSSYCNKAIAPR